jgi:CubicO group peptidase (beta-lactamase class C family)
VDTRIEQIADEALKDRTFPGCVVGYIRDGKHTVLPFGQLTYDLAADNVNADTVYDVASITKSIPTGCLILYLIESGLLSLDDKAILYIPELKNQYRDEILIRHLLTYTVVFDLPNGLSGVAKEAPDKILEIVFAAPLKYAPGTTYVYTSPPALLLGLIVERITKMHLNEYANIVFGPLPMPRTSFSSGWVDQNTVAPTEQDYRGLVRGVPHDEAAWAFRRAGRIAGHAGLFSCAPDLLVFMQMLLNEGEYDGRRYFTPATVASMHTNQIPDLPRPTGLAWEMGWPFLGQDLAGRLYGKTGFTGCLVLLDPDNQRAMVHLSNRTYPHRPETKDAIQEFWGKLATVVFDN